MKNDLYFKTKAFALETIKFCSQLPNTFAMNIISKQLIRSATSVGANYRSACRGKTKRDFIYKLSIVEEEADESMYWIELLFELDFINDSNLKKIYDEINQITAMIVASKKTAKRNAE